MDTIAIDDKTRLLVLPDEDAGDPRDWGLDIDDDSPEVQAWRAGEVYGVVIERLATYTNDATGEKMSRWEETDSLWGCYLDDTYTAEVVAREYFGVSQ